jgi:phosphomannomutase
MLYYAEAELEVDGGIQITGSHNPGNYNGFKMVFFLAPSSGRTSRARPDGRGRATGRKAAAPRATRGRGRHVVDRLRQDLRRQAFRIGWDNWQRRCGAEILERLVKRLPGEHHTLYTEIDGNFPNHHPDPTVEANLADLKALVAEKGLDSESPSTAMPTGSARSTARAA